VLKPNVALFHRGFVWLSLSNPDFAFLENFSTHTFIFFAQVVWPIWIPFSFLKFKDKKESKVLGKILVGLGIVISSVLAYFLFTKHLEAEILENHIAYSQHYPENLHLIGVILYVVVTIVPPFTSSIKKMWLLGSVLTLSFVVAKIFYTEYLLSVWCFFAAVISVMILWIVVSERKKTV